jgi:hypothetical protein
VPNPIQGAAAAIAVMTTRLNALRPPKRVAVLGAPRSGKSTLLQALGRDASGEFHLVVAGKPQRFLVTEDLDGMAGQNRKSWQKAFTENDFVWYMFRADLVSEGDPAATSRLREDMQSFGLWLAKDRHPPKVVLIGTHADLAAQYETDPAGFYRAVESNEQIRVGAVRLDSDGLIVGSLIGEDAVVELTDWLRKCLQ